MLFVFCQDFNQHLEEEKEKREELTKQVEEFARLLEKQLEEESGKRMTALYEQLQDRLETINTNLGSLQVDEEELRKFVSFPSLPLMGLYFSYLVFLKKLNFAYKPSKYRQN